MIDNNFFDNGGDSWLGTIIFILVNLVLFVSHC